MKYLVIGTEGPGLGSPEEAVPVLGAVVVPRSLRGRKPHCDLLLQLRFKQ